VSAFADLDQRQVLRLTEDALNSGVPANDVLMSLQDGINNIGKEYEDGRCFLTELMAAGDIFKAAMEKLTPRLAMTDASSVGTLVLGTVRGDLHDIGKNIFKTFVESARITVHDLGVDVSPDDFVDKVATTHANIVALSSLLTTSMDQIRVVIEELKKAGLRSKIKIIIGGNSITDEFGKEVGADAAVRDAALGARICKEWMRG
jgi:methanogenic corrinoid protein MtbC1